MDVKLWLETAVLKKIAIESKKEEILGAVVEHWQNAIDNNIPPALKARTEFLKKRQGLAKPTTPLYGSGDLYNGLALGEVTDRSVRILYKSKVNPAWHRGDHRARGVPKRDPLSDRTTLLSKIIKILRGG